MDDQREYIRLDSVTPYVTPEVTPYVSRGAARAWFRNRPQVSERA